MNRAKVHIAAGLPLTWVATQKEDFQKYLLQNECVDFTFRNKEYHVEFAGADIYPLSLIHIFALGHDLVGAFACVLRVNLARSAGALVLDGLKLHFQGFGPP